MSDINALQKVQKILTELVSFDTTSAKPNRACINFIQDYLKQYNIVSDVIASEKGDKACLWVTIGTSDKPGIVLAGHTDVVPVDGQAWTTDPFTLSEREGKLYGRGSCDMKAFIACVLALVPELVAQKLPQPVHLAFTHDEETDMSGALRLTDFMSQKEIKPEWVWIGEPTELRIIDSHKGVALFSTTMTGVAGHSSKPDKGLNAIECMAQFMSILQRVAQSKKDAAFKPSRFDPPYSTFNMGVIQGGTAENIIAEHCELEWQTRTHPGDHLEETLDLIEKTAQTEMASRFKAFAPQAGMVTCTCFKIPPLMPSVNNPATKLLSRLTGGKEPQAISFATEAGFFQKLGSHVIVCGPGSIDQAHKADEFVAKDQLVMCIDLLRQVLLCSGTV